MRFHVVVTRFLPQNGGLAKNHESLETGLFLTAMTIDLAKSKSPKELCK